MITKNRLVTAGLAAVLALSLMIPIAVCAADKESPAAAEPETSVVTEAETSEDTEDAENDEPEDADAEEEAPAEAEAGADAVDEDAAPEEIGDVTDEEAEKIIQELLDELEGLDQEDTDELIDKYSDELDDLRDQASELFSDEDWNELVNDFTALIKEIDFGELIADIGDWFGIEYGDLTQDEITELKSIWTRIGNIGGEMIADIIKNADTLTEEQIEQMYSKYEDELDRLTKRAEELEKKAGWEEYDDDWDLDDEDWDWDLDDEDDGEALFNFDISDEDLEELGNLLEEIFGSIDTANI